MFSLRHLVPICFAAAINTEDVGIGSPEASTVLPILDHKPQNYHHQYTSISPTTNKMDNFKKMCRLLQFHISWFVNNKANLKWSNIPLILKKWNQPFHTIYQYQFTAICNTKINLILHNLNPQFLQLLRNSIHGDAPKDYISPNYFKTHLIFLEFIPSIKP